MQYMWLLGFIVLLVILSIFDIRTKRIPPAGFISVFILSVLYICLSGDQDISITGLVISCIPGIILGMLSFITEGKIGFGDALVTLGLGIGLGIERISYVITGALIMICIFSIIMLSLKKIHRRSEIPFIPFITLGMGVMGFVFR